MEAALHRSRQLLAEGSCDLLVLDDINPQLDRCIITELAVRDLIAGKPQSATIVLTGRFAPQWVLEMADIVTDFAELKHPVHAGVGPRKGIEF